jgi:hypothetical protein
VSWDDVQRDRDAKQIRATCDIANGDNEKHSRVADVTREPRHLAHDASGVPGDYEDRSRLVRCELKDEELDCASQRATRHAIHVDDNYPRHLTVRRGSMNTLNAFDGGRRATED